jgi:transposase-like protein
MFIDLGKGGLRMNKRMRTTYPPEFKLQAVERAKAGDRSIRGLEQEMGLSENLLRSWVQAYDRKGAQAFVHEVGGGNGAGSGVGGEPPGAGSGTAAEVRKQQRALEQRVAQLERENEILKKALALLSRDQWHGMP